MVMIHARHCTSWSCWQWTLAAATTCSRFTASSSALYPPLGVETVHDSLSLLCSDNALLDRQCQVPMVLKLTQGDQARSHSAQGAWTYNMGDPRPASAVCTFAAPRPPQPPSLTAADRRVCREGCRRRCHFSSRPSRQLPAAPGFGWRTCRSGSAACRRPPPAHASLILQSGHDVHPQNDCTMQGHWYLRSSRSLGVNCSLAQQSVATLSKWVIACLGTYDDATDRSRDHDSPSRSAPPNPLFLSPEPLTPRPTTIRPSESARISPSLSSSSASSSRSSQAEAPIA